MRKMAAFRRFLNIETTREKKREIICGAVRGRRPIEFYYHGGYRTVEPFCLGIVLEGEADNESLLCFQTAGYSELREVVGWKLYRESEMENIQLLNEQFAGDRPGYDPENIAMALIFCRVLPVREAKEEADLAGASTMVRAVLGVDEEKPETMEPVTLTHNELMKLFRSIHPYPPEELYRLLLMAGPPTKYLADMLRKKRMEQAKGCRVPFIRGSGNAAGKKPGARRPAA